MKAKEQFAKEYFSAGRRKRPVFEKHLGELGAQAMLDFLEATYPHCHGQAHEFGQALFARLKDIGPALRECKTRCTSGCMHGVLMEVFAGTRLGSGGVTSEHHVIFDDVVTQMTRLCAEREMTSLHKPGNCAHGVGHALMVVTGHDVEKSLEGCSAFGNPAMAYYCATGIFMEYLLTGRRDDPRLNHLHFPCDTFTRFPAACYRYKVPQMLRALGQDARKVAAECLKLPPRLRLGCFHGLGTVHLGPILKNPSVLPQACSHGGPADQAVCIEGAIEKLSDFDERRAMAACATLDGDNAEVCQAAAQEKMYRLTKPTMELYIAR
ncbi:MAG: hypothetical protein L0191_19175 [Acidobacteria bacterium]|nr:hypothetical protein [Acidobacteriota bacterium]